MTAILRCNLIPLAFIVQNESFLTLRDLKGCKLSGNVFNILFNLNKFMAFEIRDPFLIRQVSAFVLLHACPFLTLLNVTLMN